MTGRIIHWKPNVARRYPQIGAAGSVSLVRVSSRGAADMAIWSGIPRSRLVNAGAIGTLVRGQLANGGG